MKWWALRCCDHLKTRLHAINARHIQNTRFIALCGFVELHCLLGEELRRMDVPRTDQSWAAELEISPGHVDNADGHRPEHPFVGIGAQEIDELRAERKGAECLDGVDGKQDALSCKSAPMASTSMRHPER